MINQPYSNIHSQDYKLVAMREETERIQQEWSSLAYESEESQELVLLWCMRKSQLQRRRDGE